MREEFDKADWSSWNIKILLDILLEETEAGNRPCGNMTTRAYKNLAVKYFEKT
uniref:Myb/SANT-like domain-containing protein n=1 Tax=Arundo donax TaxID=35708 RepID=A0A0A8XTG0_ARUDO